jgi:NitT/TauT family transport system substrate-binding protein
MAKANAAITKPGEAAKVLPEVTKVDPGLVPMLIPNLGTYPTSLDPKRLQRVVTLMQNYGGFTQSLDVQSLIVPVAS